MLASKRVLVRLPDNRYREMITGDSWTLICEGIIGGGRSHHEYEILGLDGQRLADEDLEEDIIMDIVPNLTFGEGL